jgi:hypothetical protein
MLRRFQSGELLEELFGIGSAWKKNLAEAVRLGDETRGMGDAPASPTCET